MVCRIVARCGAQEPTLPSSGHHRRAARPLPHRTFPPNRQPTKIHHLCRPCSPPRARHRRLPAENIVSARVLLRCHCAAASDSLRCDARSTRRAAWTASTTTEHTRRAHRMRSSDARRRFVSRTGAGVVGVESKHSESSRPRHRPRSREPGTIPPVRVRCSMTGRRGRLGGRRASTGRLRGVATLSRAPCRPEAQQSPLGTAERRLRGAL